ncbi:SURF1 family cytochrome oxidase biogenesis protein [Pacificimonas sp. ICDLI1SI03]
MKLPLVPTIMVVLAVPVLIALGIWQLGRADEKAAMLAALSASPDLPTVTIEGADWPDTLDFRHIRTSCQFVGDAVAKAGRNASGAAGYSYFADCRPGPSVRTIEVNLGWDARPDRTVPLPRGEAVPVMGLARHDRSRANEGDVIPYVMIAAPPLASLSQSRIPTTEDIPDNHMAYAVQWFGFAATLAIIYLVYVRGWRRGRKV